MLRNETTRRLLLLATSLVAVAAAGELLLRLDHRRKARAVLAGRDPAELITRPAPPPLLYRLEPDLPGVTNSHGFRDLERPRAKPAGSYRIAVVGDSVAMQMSIPFDELWVRRLEPLLAGAVPDRRVELLNFGVTGYGTGQQLALLESEVPAFEPDALLWQYHHNDAADPVLDGANGGLGLYYHRPASHLASFLGRRWRHLAWRRAARRQGFDQLTGDLARQLFWWRRTGEQLESLQRVARRQALPVLLFVLPAWPADDRWEVYDGANGELHRRIVVRFRELGFETLDLLPALSREDPARLRLAADDPWHPNSAGHAWLAEQLAAWLPPRLPADVAGPAE